MSTKRLIDMLEHEAEVEACKFMCIEAWSNVLSKFSPSMQVHSNDSIDPFSNSIVHQLVSSSEADTSSRTCAVLQYPSKPMILIRPRMRCD
jgi:hypothetical protein